MKALSVFIGLISLFITLPVTLFMSYLLYSHVNATPLMWFLWWFQLPLNVLVNVVGVVVGRFLVEKK